MASLSGGVGVPSGVSNRKTCRPLTSVYGENMPATSPTVSVAGLEEIPWMVATTV